MPPILAKPGFEPFKLFENDFNLVVRTRMRFNPINEFVFQIRVLISDGKIPSVRARFLFDERFVNISAAAQILCILWPDVWPVFGAQGLKADLPCLFEIWRLLHRL